MKSVRELCADARAMHSQGVPPHEVARRLIEMAHHHGYVSIVHRSSPPVIELLFGAEEGTVRFDGATWR